MPSRFTVVDTDKNSVSRFNRWNWWNDRRCRNESDNEIRRNDRATRGILILEDSPRETYNYRLLRPRLHNSVGRRTRHTCWNAVVAVSRNSSSSNRQKRVSDRERKRKGESGKEANEIIFDQSRRKINAAIRSPSVNNRAFTPDIGDIGNFHM